MPYTTKHLYTTFGVSHQTIKNWAKDFADFMSPTARPEGNHQRRFTDEDVRVFDLVNSMKKQGSVNEEIRAALGAGQRGELPEMPKNLATVPSGTALAIALQRVKVLEAEIDLYKAMTSETEGQNKLLKEQLKQTQDELFDAKYELKQMRMQLKFEDGK